MEIDPFVTPRHVDRFQVTPLHQVGQPGQPTDGRVAIVALSQRHGRPDEVTATSPDYGTAIPPPGHTSEPEGRHLNIVLGKKRPDLFQDRPLSLVPSLGLEIQHRKLALRLQGQLDLSRHHRALEQTLNAMFQRGGKETLRVFHVVWDRTSCGQLDQRRVGTGHQTAPTVLMTRTRLRAWHQSELADNAGATLRANTFTTRSVSSIELPSPVTRLSLSSRPSNLMGVDPSLSRQPRRNSDVRGVQDLESRVRMGAVSTDPTEGRLRPHPDVLSKHFLTVRRCFSTWAARSTSASTPSEPECGRHWPTPVTSKRQHPGS